MKDLEKAMFPLVIVNIRARGTSARVGGWMRVMRYMSGDGSINWSLPSDHLFRRFMRGDSVALIASNLNLRQHLIELMLRWYFVRLSDGERAEILK